MNILEKILEAENLAAHEEQEVQDVKDAGLKDSEETLRLLEENDNKEDSVWAEMINPFENINQENVVETRLKKEHMDNIEGFEGQEVIVTGSPFELAEKLDSCQGDNFLDIPGDCGLVSCVNCLRIAGFDDITEDVMIAIALKYGMCVSNPFEDSSEWGATTLFHQKMILEFLGIEATIYSPEDAGGSIQEIAEAVEDGHTVLMDLNSGILWDEPDYIDGGYSNHAVTITGTVRDTTGQLVALTICDSGSGNDDSCRVVSVDLLKDCYANAIGSGVVISDVPVR